MNRRLSFAIVIAGFAAPWAQSATLQPFEGTKSEWHGFERHDLVMDLATGEVKPFERDQAKEGAGIGAPAAGTRRCIVVSPKNPADGNPWSWRGCYWDHQPGVEVELLKRGFHVVYISASNDLKPDESWEKWYGYLVAHGLATKSVMVGMSRGGEFGLTWAVRHPDRVAGVYADNPGGNEEVMRGVPDLAKKDVPLMLVCGSIDPLMGMNAGPIEGIYTALGGRVSTLVKEGSGHHPHSLKDPTPIADFLEKSEREGTVDEPWPAFATTGQAVKQVERNWYVPAGERFERAEKDGYFEQRCGAEFVGAYRRYVLWMTGSGMSGLSGRITVILPKTPAAGQPWVLRAGNVGRDDLVDAALLARGYAVAVGPVGTNEDGVVVERWNAVVSYLVGQGFAPKPAVEADRAGAGAMYVWAVENPEKIRAIAGLDAVMWPAGAKVSPLERLDALARAGVEVLQVVTAGDPAREDSAEIVRRYTAAGGKARLVEAKEPNVVVKEVIGFLTEK